LVEVADIGATKLAARRVNYDYFERRCDSHRNDSR
jgi:hypothetical protein